WTHRLENRPRGDTTFWAEAVQTRLAPQFTEVTRQPVGEWSCVTLQQPGEDPYRWWICLAVDGRRLRVAQAYFPSLDHERRYGAAVREALGGEPAQVGRAPGAVDDGGEA